MNFLKPQSQSEGAVRYSCNFSNRNIKTNQFNMLLVEHKDQVHRAIILDISQNMIDDLNLKNIPLIETIKASNNVIKSVNLNLDKLLKLDLSFNRLKSIPDFLGASKLKILLLNNNFIQEINQEDFINLKSLSILELSNNKIKFKDVESFIDVVNSWGNLTKLSLINNPFTYNEIYNRKYFEYIENCIQSLESLNGKSLIKLQKKKGLTQVIAEEMLQEELKSSNSNSVLEKIREKLENIQISQIDVSSSVIEELRELKKLYQEKLSQNTFRNEEEYIKDDQDTDIFDDLLNYAVYCVETIPKLDKFLIEIFIFLSSVRKGKWAKKCFGFLKHMADSDDGLLSLIESEIYDNYKQRLSVLNKNNIHDKNVGNIDYLMLLEDVPLVLGAMRMFVNADFPIIVDLLYAFIISLFQFYQKEEIDKVINKLSYSNDSDKKIGIIKKPIFLLFKYSIEILSLSFRKTCYSIIDDDVTYEQLDTFFNIAEMFIKEFVQNKNLNNKKFYKMFGNILKIVKKIMANPTILTNHGIILQKVVQNYIAKKMIDTLRNYVHSYYTGKKQILFSTDSKISKENLTLNILNNLIFGYLLKLFLFLIRYINNKSFDVNYIISIAMNNNKIQVDSNIDFNCDPVMLNYSVYAIRYLLKNLNFFWNFENMSSFFSFMESINSQIAYFLYFIDETKDNYKKANVIADIYVTKEEIYRETLKINENNNFYILKLINSIVILLKFFNEQGKFQKDNQIRKMFQNLNNILNKIDRDNLLINCLTSPSSKIKSNVISCFLYASYDQIEADELYKLLRTLSESNWLDGKMEMIISNTFFFVLKYFESRFDEGSKILSRNPSIIQIVLDIVQKNTERATIKDEDVDNIRALNAASAALLINFSGYKDLKSYFDNIDYSEVIKRILVNEYNSVIYYSKIKENPKKSKKRSLANSEQPIMFPLEIEKCFTGWKTERIKSFFNSDGIQPYNYISARVFNHLANSLMNIPYKTIDISNQEFFDFANLIKLYFMKEVNRMSLEKLTWKSFKQEVNKLHQIEALKEQKDSSENQFIQFSKEFSIYEQQLQFVQHFRFFLDWLIGNSNGKFMNELLEKLHKEKFDPNLSPDNTYPDNESNSLEELITMLNKDFDATKLKERNIKDISKLFLMAYSNNKNSDSRNNLEDYFNSHLHIKNDLNIEDKYAINEKMVKRNLEYECVDNPQLRSLFISIFLRCIYSVLIQNQIIKDAYPLSVNIRIMMNNNSNNLIDQLRSYECFQKFATLVDSSRLESFNIPTKFLVIINKILKNLSSQNENGKGSDQIDKLIMLSAVIISKILHKMKNKTNFNNDDKQLVSSLVKCCLTILFEINFINIDKKTKNKIIQKIMSERLIRILIATLNDSMIDENEGTVNGDNVEYINYKMMMTSVAKLLAEYMSINENNSYRVFELLNIKINIDKREIRKTYVKDLIQFCNFKKIKEDLKNQEIFKGLKIIFVTDCLLIDNEYRKITKAYFILAREGIYFLDFIYKENILLNIPLADMKKIYFPIFSNRVFIATAKKGISILFKHTLLVQSLQRNLYSISNKIEMANNCFLDTEEFLSFKEIKRQKAANKNEDNKKDNSVNKNNSILAKDVNTNPEMNQSMRNKTNQMNHSKKDNTLNDKPLTSTQFKKLHRYMQRSKLDRSADRIKVDSNLLQEEDIEIENDNMNKSFSNLPRKIKDIKNEEVIIKDEVYRYVPVNNIFLVSIENKSIGDFFGVENRYIRKPKILYFEKVKDNPNLFKSLLIINESYEALSKINIDDDYLSRDGKLFDNFKNCYETEAVYNLDDLEYVTFLSYDTIDIGIKSNSIKFSVLDDYSYFNIRQILVMASKKKNMKNVKKKFGD